MKTISILVAEDFDIIREDICDGLNRAEGLSVIGGVGKGCDAYAFIKEHPDTDIVLMDIEMEHPNAGIEAAEKIFKEFPNVKIIFLTAYEKDDMILKGMATGAVDYVVKDIEMPDLIQKVKNAYADKVTLDAYVKKIVMDEYARLRYSERSLLFFINNVGKLTPAEKELVKLLLDGKKNREIAEFRHVEIGTIKTQIRSLLGKFGCTRKEEVVKMIHDLNLVQLFAEQGKE